MLQHFYDPQTTGRKVLGIYVCIYIYMFCTNVKCGSMETRLYCHLIRIRSGLDM